MNLFTDAYYRCACGRLSLYPVCPRCTFAAGIVHKIPSAVHETVNKTAAMVNRDALILNNPVVSVNNTDPLPVTPAMRAKIEEGRREFLNAGVFDLWAKQLPTRPAVAGELIYILTPKGEMPATPHCIPIYRVRRIPGGLRERWREVPLLPLVSKKTEDK